MKLDQLEYNKRNFLQNHAENEAGRLVPDLLLLLKKEYEAKASGLQLTFSVF